MRSAGYRDTRGGGVSRPSIGYRDSRNLSAGNSRRSRRDVFATVGILDGYGRRIRVVQARALGIGVAQNSAAQVRDGVDGISTRYSSLEVSHPSGQGVGCKGIDSIILRIGRGAESKHIAVKPKYLRAQTS